MSTEYQNQGQEGAKDHRYRKAFPDDPKKTPATTPENQAWRVNGAFVVSTHVVAILALVFYRPKFLTIIFSLVLWQGACLGKYWREILQLIVVCFVLVCLLRLIDDSVFLISCLLLVQIRARWFVGRCSALVSGRVSIPRSFKVSSRKALLDWRGDS